MRQLLSILKEKKKILKNFHNARSLQENLARSVANQSARTVVAI